ncbi:hypothetical protein NDU88_009202 [Pleurodeles waltl]|uniref:Transmembrane protein n=1 Tax=Pleurodeles waltl TaxID=8319 RepID=A0AAV7S0C4_PLEWA|nr:hypothetical protein NDU88_009202 [Pleurodeles waltl]
MAIWCSRVRALLPGFEFAGCSVFCRSGVYLLLRYPNLLRSMSSPDSHARANVPHRLLRSATGSQFLLFFCQGSGIVLPDPGLRVGALHCFTLVGLIFRRGRHHGSLESRKALAVFSTLVRSVLLLLL